MSKIRVNAITSIGGTAPVVFETGITGDGSGLTMKPVAVSFDPTATATGISTTTNITVIFDQDVEFSGVGTIYIREGSASGTIATSFTCGVSAGATIAGSSLVINPTDPLDFNQLYVVSLPSVGIANSLGAYYGGTDGYSFTTLESSFTATGGNHVFDVVDGGSPTGYYRYHVFTSSGQLVTTAPTTDATNLSSLIVAGGGAGGSNISASPGYSVGGGGGGGLLTYTGPTLALPAGTYTITVGSGGVAAQTPSITNTSGENSTISTPSSVLVTAYGGGAGGCYGSPARPDTSPSDTGVPGGSGGGGRGGSPSGTGVPGQGFNGGPAFPHPPSYNSGSGGGAGGAGGSYSPSYSGSVGGNGKPVPEFSSPVIGPRVPDFPAHTLSEIGPSGLYGGGGGGGLGNGPNGGPNGGPGGGGASALVTGSSESPDGGNVGARFTGGGGGSGYQPYTAYQYPGGSGVFMMRYTTPAP